MSALYPNVPLAIAGVPAVLRRQQDLEAARTTIERAQRDITNSISAQRWGVFALDGTPVLEPDSVGSFEYGGEYRIVDFPVEGGSFETYDKVATPFNTRLSLTKGGTLPEREEFLTKVEALRSSLDLFNIVTPERTYLNVNVERVGMVRNATNGAGMLTVELVLREIRQAARAQYSRTDTAPDETLATTPRAQSAAPPVSAAPGTTRQPAAVRKVNQGSVQPKRVVVSGATLTTTASGRQVYVYDRAPGGR